MKSVLKILFLLCSNLILAQESPSVASQNSQNIDTIYKILDVNVKPEFPGGIEMFYTFVQQTFIVPQQEGLIGKIFIAFAVEKDGTLSDLKVLRDAGFGTGKEALRVLKLSPKWNPAIKDGQPVRCIYTIPIAVAYNSSTPPKK